MFLVKDSSNFQEVSPILDRVRWTLIIYIRCRFGLTCYTAQYVASWLGPSDKQASFMNLF